MTYRIGCGAGFSGDRIDGPTAVVAALAGTQAALMFETLAERTLALRHLDRRHDPGTGYEPLLADLVLPVLPDCLAAGIPIVGNFGAANPSAAAARLCQHAPARVATVHGDDVTGIDIAGLDVVEQDGALERPGPLIAANVYLGAKPIADALRAGAQVVVTGRVADPALALGPLVAHFGWAWDDWDRLAAGTLAGHLLECGTQVTGGYFADPGLKDVPRPEAIGFPIAEVEPDGTFTITKPPGTGGCVTIATVTEQLLYEIHDPAAYVTPDVVLDITRVTLTQTGPDRVHVAGARGHPRPPTLKLTASFEGDWIGEAEISYAGPNATARARLAAATIAARLDLRRLSVRRRIDLIGTMAVFDDDTGTLAPGTLAHAAPDLPEVRVRPRRLRPHPPATWNRRRRKSRPCSAVVPPAVAACGSRPGPGSAPSPTSSRARASTPGSPYDAAACRRPRPRRRQGQPVQHRRHRLPSRTLAHPRAGHRRAGGHPVSPPPGRPGRTLRATASRRPQLRHPTTRSRAASNGALGLDIHGKTLSFLVLGLTVDVPDSLRPYLRFPTCAP